ncbi:MAG: hypothetical protein GY861_20895 [bacterium]|nr:hypothetical protein [bacterium]
MERCLIEIEILAYCRAEFRKEPSRIFSLVNEQENQLYFLVFEDGSSMVVGATHRDGLVTINGSVKGIEFGIPLCNVIRQTIAEGIIYSYLQKKHEWSSTVVAVPIVSVYEPAFKRYIEAIRNDETVGIFPHEDPRSRVPIYAKVLVHDVGEEVENENLRYIEVIDYEIDPDTWNFKRRFVVTKVVEYTYSFSVKGLGHGIKLPNECDPYLKQRA